jgi:hypothetical protein
LPVNARLLTGAKPWPPPKQIRQIVCGKVIWPTAK